MSSLNNSPDLNDNIPIAEDKSIDNQQKHKKNRTRLIALIIILLLLLLIIGSMIAYNYAPAHTSSSGTIYFRETFENSSGEWSKKSLDYNVLSAESGSGTGKIVILSKDKYEAPHIMIPIDSSIIPTKDYVVHVKIKLSDNDIKPQTLLALSLPSEPIVVFLGKDSHLGILHNISQTPSVSRKKFNLIAVNEWQDVYVYVNTSNEKCSIYLNDRGVFTEKWTGSASPLQSIWLGSVWIGSNGHFEASDSVEYSDVFIGDKYTLPHHGIFWTALTASGSVFWGFVDACKNIYHTIIEEIQSLL